MNQPPSTYDHFRPVLSPGHTSVVGDILNIATALPGLATWTPTTIDAFAASSLMQTLVPIWHVNGDGSFAEAYEAIAAALSLGAVGVNRGPKLPSVAELACAACLKAFGAADVKKIVARVGARTPDLATLWPTGEEVQVEVIYPEQKAGHRENTNWMAGLIEELHSLGRSFDLKVVCLRQLTRDERSRLVSAASVIGPDSMTEAEGVWHLQSETPPHAPGTIWIGGFNHVPLPPWWPAQRFALRIQFRMALGTPDDAQPNPRVFGVVGLPFDGYLNPVRAKADRPQGEKGKPFLIGVDVGDLHDAERVFKAELPNWFQQWPHVSGVLAFRDFLSAELDKHTYRATLFANPHATLALPEGLLKITYQGLPWDSDLALKSGA